jgi:WD40 repeat protein
MGVAISKNGKRLVSGSFDNTTRVWDLEKGIEVRKWTHAQGVRHLTLSPDGKRAVTTSMDNMVKVWDVDTGKELHTLKHPGMIWHVAISPDGRNVYTGGGGGLWNNGPQIQPNATNSLIRVWDLNTGKELRQLTGHGSYVMGLEFSANGRLLASCGYDGTVRLWGAK